MTAKAAASVLPILLLVSIWLCGPADEAAAGSLDTGTTQAFLTAAALYRDGDYRQAAAGFESITAAGVVNGTLYYNLANAYLKSGDLGRAILWYERANDLIPRDPDLQFNYAYARSMRADEGEPGDAIYRILFFWRYQLGRLEILWAAVGFNAAFWLILALRILLRKRPLNAAAILVLSAALVLTLTAGVNYYEDRHPRRAVILSAEASVRSGWTPEATELFVLHAGTRVRLEDDRGRFLKIYFAPGKIGWINRSDAGMI